MTSIPARRYCAVAVAVLLSVAATALPGRAQQSLDGRVVLGGRGVAGVPVTLHRVTQDSAGAGLMVRSGANGSFRFTLPPADRGGFTVFLATAEYRGVRYIGPPLHPQDQEPDYTIEVFDTTRAGSQPLQVSRRDVVMLPEADGGWEVNEIVQIRNAGTRTLVAAGQPATWEHSVPEDVLAFEVGDGEVAPADVRRMGSRVLVQAALPPGTRELFIRYRLPATDSEMELAVAHPTDQLNLFVRQPSPRPVVEGLSTTERIEADGESFVRYSGTDLPAGSAVRIEWEGSGAPPLPPVTTALALASIVLASGTWAAARRRPNRPASDRG